MGEEATGIEGALFVVRRRVAPFVQLKILNKRSKHDFTWTIDASTEFDLNGSLLSFRQHPGSEEGHRDDDAAYGVWCRSADDLYNVQEAALEEAQRRIGAAAGAEIMHALGRGGATAGRDRSGGVPAAVDLREQVKSIVLELLEDEDVLARIVGRVAQALRGTSSKQPTSSSAPAPAPAPASPASTAQAGQKLLARMAGSPGTSASPGLPQAHALPPQLPSPSQHHHHRQQQQHPSPQPQGQWQHHPASSAGMLHQGPRPVAMGGMPQGQGRPGYFHGPGGFPRGPPHSGGMQGYYPYGRPSGAPMMHPASMGPHGGGMPVGGHPRPGAVALPVASAGGLPVQAPVVDRSMPADVSPPGSGGGAAEYGLGGQA